VCVLCRILQENIPAKELERRGLCLLRLVIASRHVGLYGRTVLQFEAAKDLPSHSFTPGMNLILLRDASHYITSAISDVASQLENLGSRHLVAIFGKS